VSEQQHGPGVRVDVVDLARAARGRGPQWGMQSTDLNATLLEWPAGAGFREHRNDERDVLVLLPRGSAGSLTAGPIGARYLSIHTRREPLRPESCPALTA
jgi:hypothetical protein